MIVYSIVVYTVEIVYKSSELVEGNESESIFDVEDSMIAPERVFFLVGADDEPRSAVNVVGAEGSVLCDSRPPDPIVVNGGLDRDAVRGTERDSPFLVVELIVFAESDFEMAAPVPKIWVNEHV